MTKLTRHILRALLLLTPLAGEAQPLPTDSLPAADTVAVPLPADTLPPVPHTLMPDTPAASALPPDSLTAVFRADSLAADSLPAMALPDSIVPDSLSADTLRTDTLALDTTGIGTLSMEEMCRALQQLHLADIDLDKYFAPGDTLDTVPPALPADSTARPDSIAPPPPPDLLTLLRRGGNHPLHDTGQHRGGLRHARPLALHPPPARLRRVPLQSPVLRPGVPPAGRPCSTGGSTAWPTRCSTAAGGTRCTPRWTPLPCPTRTTSWKKLRQDARDYITRTDVLLYSTTIDRLPKVDWTDNEQVHHQPIRDYAIDDFGHAPVVTSNRIVVRRKEFSPWSGRLNSLFQFSQTAVSKNWHQGATTSSRCWEASTATSTSTTAKR